VEHGLKVHTLFTGVANTFIVEDAPGLVVIDAGMPHRARQIVRAIQALGHDPQQVQLILITHGHIDHAGSAVELRKLTGAPIAMHADDLRLVETRTLKIPPGRTATTEMIGTLLRMFGWVVPLDTFTPDVWLTEEQSLREFGFDACIAHTPGHTAGSVSMLCSDGTMFVGDAILNMAHVAFPLFWEDAAAAYSSALKIHALKPRVCFTAHGRDFDPSELDQFIARISSASALSRHA
jgi:glyoxylase-like metal-dependent hydrolase (beta-lactamase superfamily II)